MDADSKTAELAIGTIVMGLFGGLALFLFGMEQMTDGLKRVAGEGMRKVLGSLTKNRFTAAITGAFVTAVIQSSSVTTVLVVGFISAGMMSLTQSVGVIMGANIGTTITAQIVAFKVTKYAMILIATGFAFLFFAKRDRVKRVGGMIMGLGLIFFGMDLMSEATRPLRTYEPFIDLMQSMTNPVLGILAAAAFTALVQSSSATTGIVIVLAGQGFITLEAGIALAFGANIGTCVTAMLATLGKPRTALQAAAVHIFFNVAGVLLWVFFIPYLADFVRAISPTSPGLSGTDRMASETPRQIANAHTAFNVANTVLFLAFTGVLAKLIERILPVKLVEVPERARAKYLDDALLETPALATERIKLELNRLGRHVFDLSADANHAVVSGTSEELKEIERLESESETLFETIVCYIGRLSKLRISDKRANRLAFLTAVGNNIQHLGETLGIDLLAVGRDRIQRGLTISEGTQAAFAPFRAKVRGAFVLALESFEAEDPNLAREVIAMKLEIQDLANQMTERLSERLTADAPNRRVAFRIENQIVELLMRYYYFSKKIAKEVVAQSRSREE